MARRAGKAANRKARQRKVQRSAAPPPVSVPASADSDAVEPATAVTAPSAPAPARGNLIASSQLSASERNEYHYVERDLRDIGILTLVMTGLLLAAWFAFRALGLLG